MSFFADGEVSDVGGELKRAWSLNRRIEDIRVDHSSVRQHHQVIKIRRTILRNPGDGHLPHQANSLEQNFIAASGWTIDGLDSDLALATLHRRPNDGIPITDHGSYLRVIYAAKI